MSRNTTTAHKQGVEVCSTCMMHAFISRDFGKKVSASFVATRAEAMKELNRLFNNGHLDLETYTDLKLEVMTHPNLHDDTKSVEATLGDLNIADIIRHCHPQHDYPEIPSIKLRPPLVAYN